MPRRKRAADEGGRRVKVSSVEHNDEETLVISDSEHEEEEDCSFKRSSWTTRLERRENQSHLQKMTEEDMLNLAMRLSTQEANRAAQRQELEDNDIQKAIEESLNESSLKALEGHDEAASSTDQPQQNVTSEISTSPLPEMSDPSQKTSIHLSIRSSPAQVSSPPASTQDTTSDEQTVISNTPELFRSVSESQSQTSPVFTRHGCLIHQPVVCVEKLSQDLIPASIDSNFHMQDGAAASICTYGSPSPKQEDSPFSKCPVFTQKDFKRKMYLPEDKDGRKNTNASEDDTHISNEDIHLPTQKSPNLKQAEDQTTLEENVKSDNETAPNTWNEFASHMDLHLTDEDDGSEEFISPSPVLHKNIFQPVKTELSPTQSCISPAVFTPNPYTQDTQMSRSVLEEGSGALKGVEFKPSDCKPPHTSLEKGECTISYFWGVPFCPMGQNPDEYTRVILCQMEVYEKSLKEAQRELLRKADWGEPVIPGSSERPFGARRWKRHRAPQLSEDEEENDKDGEKENNRIDVEEEREEAKEESVVGSQEDAEGRQCETYVVVSSPETKDEQEEKKPFFSQEEPVTAALNKHFRGSAPCETPDETQIQCSAEQEKEEAQNHVHCEEDDIVCPETQLTQNSTPEELMVTSPAQPQSHTGSEVIEVEEGGCAPVVEEMMETEGLECPMCSKLFPLDKIEVHAALCNGEIYHQEEQLQEVVARRKRTKINLTEETPRSGKSTQMEKWSFPEYPEHDNFCIEKKDLRANQENGLLSALDQTEQRQSGTDEPGPSEVSTTSNCGLADPVVMGTSESVVCSAMTSCTSTAFIPQSENTDCLIDSSKNSQRLSRKRKFKR
ncbi:BRCA1-A complex subunit RAP80 isoform X1 [Carassius gibelio]|uniref:BRCA1-A complex subunit RAP80 isoform X1 n=2 Tax=Carassius gibelio TaxID=101364 RepID=UPI0022790138|nr:BRCA1-A complex subunit RAP80 isoform X1 [Carassius gibelio]XP_052392390.1 BRCA1-A complex subunit RAP80 isoform X1 [Carassius gibelio]